MKHVYTLKAILSVAFCAAAAQGKVTQTTGFSPLGSGFCFADVPLPADNDAATHALFTLVDGARDANSGGLDALHDGRMPSGEDQPSKNFFFRAGSDGGRIRVDLGRTISLKRICSYSWHAGDRAPQVYEVYGAGEGLAGANLEPKRDVDPATCGWTSIARVDTRQANAGAGGQYGVVLAAEQGVIGSFRYLLFAISRTEGRDVFGNTFYSEIDVVDANGPALTSSLVALNPIRKSVQTQDGKYRFTIDSTQAPDLAKWAETELASTAQAWYPKLASWLPSDGYQAPSEITLRFRDDMGGTPASASGAGVNLNVAWFRRELTREALGCVIHEMTHVVQDYGRARRTNPNAVATPGWVVEGIADYVRWFLFEPQTHGAEITKNNLANARYDASYRITANFLNWVTQTYDKDLVQKLNAAAREGRYAEPLWKAWTGKSVQELGDEWKAFNAQRLGGGPSAIRWPQNGLVHYKGPPSGRALPRYESVTMNLAGRVGPLGRPEERLPNDL